MGQGVQGGVLDISLGSPVHALVRGMIDVPLLSVLQLFHLFQHSLLFLFQLIVAHCQFLRHARCRADMVFALFQHHPHVRFFFLKQGFLLAQHGFHHFKFQQLRRAGVVLGLAVLFADFHGVFLRRHVRQRVLVVEHRVRENGRTENRKQKTEEER